LDDVDRRGISSGATNPDASRPMALPPGTSHVKHHVLASSRLLKKGCSAEIGLVPEFPRAL
jgi:hypothetical protein